MTAFQTTLSSTSLTVSYSVLVSVLAFSCTKPFNSGNEEREDATYTQARAFDQMLPARVLFFFPALPDPKLAHVKYSAYIFVQRCKVYCLHSLREIGGKTHTF